MLKYRAEVQNGHSAFRLWVTNLLLKKLAAKPLQSKQHHPRPDQQITRKLRRLGIKWVDPRKRILYRASVRKGEGVIQPNRTFLDNLRSSNTRTSWNWWAWSVTSGKRRTRWYQRTGMRRAVVLRGWEVRWRRSRRRSWDASRISTSYRMRPWITGDRRTRNAKTASTWLHTGDSCRTLTLSWSTLQRGWWRWSRWTQWRVGLGSRCDWGDHDC